METASYFSTFDTAKIEFIETPGYMYELYIMPGEPLVVKDFAEPAIINGRRSWLKDTSIYFPKLAVAERNEYMDEYDILTALHFLELEGTSENMHRISQQTKINPRLIKQGRVVMKNVS
jgi:hypothetical protein